jgi:hypothetical protein
MGAEPRLSVDQIAAILEWRAGFYMPLDRPPEAACATGRAAVEVSVSRVGDWGRAGGADKVAAAEQKTRTIE